MKKAPRTMSAVLALLMVGVSISGCHNTSNETSSIGTSTQTSSIASITTTSNSTEKLPIIGENLQYDENAPVNDGNAITLNMWVQTEYKDIYTTYTTAYSKIHPNVKFSITAYSYSDLFNKLPIALASGTGPDIFHVHNAFTSVLVPNMAPYPESVLPIDQLKKDFRQIDEHVINGKLYYIDTGLITSGIYYNKDMWSAAGLTDSDIPKSWNQFTTVAKKLTKYDKSGNITVAGFDANTQLDLLMLAMSMEQGNFVFDSTGSQANLNTPEMLKAAQYVHKLYYTDKVCNVKFPAEDQALETQRAAMIYCWGWIGATLKTKYPNLNVGFFPLPTFDGDIPPAYDRNNGESSPGVSNKSDAAHQSVAFDFIKYFLANDDAMVDVDTTFFIAPNKYSLDKNPKITNNVYISGQALELDRTIWPGPIPNAYFTDQAKYVGDDIMINNVSPAQALVKAQQVCNSDLKGFVSVEKCYKHASDMKSK